MYGCRLLERHPSKEGVFPAQNVAIEHLDAFAASRLIRPAERRRPSPGAACIRSMPPALQSTPIITLEALIIA